MVQCLNCEKHFRDNYRLNRHVSRLVPCKNKNGENQTPHFTKITRFGDKKEPLEDKKEPLEEKKEPLGEKKEPLGEKKEPLGEKKEPSNKCDFCLKTYHCIKYKNKHQTVCKFREDPVRLLEIQSGVKPKEPILKTECRFCDHYFYNVSKLNKHLSICKDREDYRQLLLKNQPVSQQIIGNNNNSNNNYGTINNSININVFGQESTDHVKTEKLIQMLRDLSIDYSKDQVYLSAGEFINLVNKYIREVPENDNFNIPDSKGLYAEIKTETGMEKVSIDRYLEKSFKSSAKTILSKKESINDQNERVFKSETNKSIFSEVKGFADNGFRHTPKNCVGTPRQVKSGYKIGMINNIGMLKKENVEIDF